MNERMNIVELKNMLFVSGKERPPCVVQLQQQLGIMYKARRERQIHGMLRRKVMITIAIAIFAGCCFHATVGSRLIIQLQKS